MAARGFQIADKKLGIALQFNADDRTVSVTHSMGPADPLTVSAALRIDDEAAAQHLRDLCDSAALPDGARTTQMLVRLSRLVSRTAYAFGYVRRPLQELIGWIATSKEFTNYTYDLTPRNMRHLAASLSLITSRSIQEIQSYLNEPITDEALREHYASALAAQSPDLIGVADATLRFGRRLGWYATVRALKPKLIVETGVDKGHGSMLLCAALARNAAEGSAGHYIGTDINPAAGYLLRGAYASYGKIMYGDSIESLQTLREPIDIFINDSDHSEDYEAREYKTVEHLLSPGSVLIGDNAHVTDKLMMFAQETQRRFLYFHEQPANHWYPGAGIGFAFR
jgi:predicted O-methyltransferase YrrM